MKSLMILTSLLVATMTALGQGYVNFASAGAGVNVPVTNATPSSGGSGPTYQRASGAGFMAMLYIAPAGTRFYSAFSTNGVEGPPATFLTGAQAGYFTGGKRAITGFNPGDTIAVLVRAWNSAFSSYEASPVCERGESTLIQVKLAGTAAGASNLVGLQPFTMRCNGPAWYRVLGNATVRIGDTVTLISSNMPDHGCPPLGFCGDPPFDFTWSFHGTNIGFGPTLTISNAQPSDAGTYAFRIENAGGPIDLSATLTVTGPPPAALVSPIYSNGSFQFTLAGETGSNYVIQSSTDLTVSNWVSRVTNTAPFTFVETNFGLSPQRFYRAIAR